MWFQEEILYLNSFNIFREEGIMPPPTSLHGMLNLQITKAYFELIKNTKLVFFSLYILSCHQVFGIQ